MADPAEHPSGPICAACGGTDAPVVDVPLHPKCAERPSGRPQTEAPAFDEAANRLRLSIFNKTAEAGNPHRGAEINAMISKAVGEGWKVGYEDGKRVAARREPLDVGRLRRAIVTIRNTDPAKWLEMGDDADAIASEYALSSTPAREEDSDD